ncbi:alkaline phosphatase PhoX [Streptomyces alkaliterrae]|uniref:alkaline phosphatase PhoX n=1 Tax=Streptomyces alkaliterrae TaxID=2213162 RepID=UPI002B21E52F|nr:alkaline phosphatase PhoX [Streptomyces alkaliterrae]
MSGWWAYLEERTCREVDADVLRDRRLSAVRSVWEALRPLGVHVSPGASVLNMPDNRCVSPRGGLVLCEDGSGTEYVHGFTTRGEVFPFAANDADLTGGTAGKNVAVGDYRGSEWAGSCFEPQEDDWVFVNIQSPGITFAITGPWVDGGL